MTFDDALVYFLGPVLGAAVRLERRSVLHASAIAVEGRALALMGDGGAGKSTLSAALVRSGARLITEDVCALALAPDAVSVYRGCARIKLWEDSVEGLYGRADALPPLVPSSTDWTKKFLDASDRMVADDVAPLERILVLARDAACTTPRIEELPAQERLLQLIANGYAPYSILPDDRADDLARLATVARTVPVQRLVYPDDFTKLPEVVDLIRRSC